MDNTSLLDKLLTQATKSCRIAIHKEYREELAAFEAANKKLEARLQNQESYIEKLEDHNSSFIESADEVRGMLEEISCLGRTADQQLKELRQLKAKKKTAAKKKGVK